MRQYLQVSDHLLQIHGHLGYRRPSEAELADLSRWLVERALEHDDPALLVRTAAVELKRSHLDRTFRRCGATARRGTGSLTSS
ncbi:MAG: DUF4158 domain-containing protein, partial [Gemmatimonadetes bacterium]|nr:DUF4158 domain-containing protein [Gemmatimonadota bacterium]